jgi:hypothetical protein
MNLADNTGMRNDTYHDMRLPGIVALATIAGILGSIFYVWSM